MSIVRGNGFVRNRKKKKKIQKNLKSSHIDRMIRRIIQRNDNSNKMKVVEGRKRKETEREESDEVKRKKKGKK